MKNCLPIALASIILIQPIPIQSKNIFAKIFCCYNAKAKPSEQQSTAPSQNSLAAPGIITPYSSPGSHMSGFLKVIVVDHPQGHIPPNPTPV